MQKRLVSSVLLASILFLAVGTAGSAFATTNTKGGVTISPPFQDIIVLPNQTSLPQSFALSNNNDTPVTFDLSAVDMGALEDTGGVVFSGLSADYQQKYGLAKWIQLEQPNVTVAAHSTQGVNFNIINDASLSPGGHYGAIVVKTSEAVATGQNKVSLLPQAATLIFVRKIGGEIYKLKFAGGIGGTSWWGLPGQLSFHLQNEGNVHVVPRGIVVVTDPRGNVVGKGIINPDSSLILPERKRTYEVTWQHIRKIALPGTYTVHVSYRYDGTNVYQNTSYTIKYIGLPFMLLALLLAFVLAWGIYYLAPRIKNRLVKLRIVKISEQPKPVSRQKIMSMRDLDRKRTTKPQKSAKNPKKKTAKRQSNNK